MRREMSRAPAFAIMKLQCRNLISVFMKMRTKFCMLKMHHAFNQPKSIK